MNYKYFDILKAYEQSEQKQPPEHLAELFRTIQRIINQAYYDGYQAATLHFEKEHIENQPHPGCVLSTY